MSKLRKLLLKSIEDLPRDCMGEICSFLETTDFVKLLRLNKYFHGLLSSKNFFGTYSMVFRITRKSTSPSNGVFNYVRQLFVKDKFIEEEELRNYLYRAPFIRKLLIRDCRLLSMTDMGKDFLKGLKHLEFLDCVGTKIFRGFGGLKILHIGLVNLRCLEKAERLEKMEELAVTKRGFIFHEDPISGKLKKMVSKAPNLRRIHFKGLPNFHESVFFQVSKLREIKIVDCEVIISDELLLSSKRLHSLKIWNFDISRIEVRISQDGMKNQYNLSKLSISGLFELDPEILDRKVLPNLEILSVFRSSEAMLEKSLTISTHLRSLKICLCKKYQHSPINRRKYEIVKLEYEEHRIPSNQKPPKEHEVFYCVCDDCKTCQDISSLKKCQNETEIRQCHVCKIVRCNGCNGRYDVVRLGGRRDTIYRGVCSCPRCKKLTCRHCWAKSCECVRNHCVRCHRGFTCEQKIHESNPYSSASLCQGCIAICKMCKKITCGNCRLLCVHCDQGGNYRNHLDDYDERGITCCQSCYGSYCSDCERKICQRCSVDCAKCKKKICKSEERTSWPWEKPRCFSVDCWVCSKRYCDRCYGNKDSFLCSPSCDRSLCSKTHTCFDCREIKFAGGMDCSRCNNRFYGCQKCLDTCSCEYCGGVCWKCATRKYLRSNQCEDCGSPLCECELDTLKQRQGDVSKLCRKCEKKMEEHLS